MRLFVAVAAVLAVAEAARHSSRGSSGSNGNQLSPSKKVRRGGLIGSGYGGGGSQQQSLQGIIDGLTASSGGGLTGISHGHGATSYAYVSGVGSHVGSPHLVTSAPVVGYALAPQVSHHHHAQLSPSYGPGVAYVPQEHSGVAYAPQVSAAYGAPAPGPISPEYGPPAGIVGDAPGPLLAGGDLAASQISKSVYVFSAPHDPSDNVRPQVYKSFPHKKQKHYQVVFINAPNPPLPAQHTVELPAPPELKTQIYVLVKKPQKAPPIKVIPAKVPVNKPEVFFIRYKNNGQGQPIQDSGPILGGGPGAGGEYGLPGGDEGPAGGPIGGPVEIQEEYGPPGGHSGPSGLQEIGGYSGEGGGGVEEHYGAALEAEGGIGYSGGPSEEYISGGGLSPELESEYGAGPPYSGPSHSSHHGGGDTYGEYSSNKHTVSTRGPMRRLRRPSLFRMRSRSDDWKPIIDKKQMNLERDAGMSGI